MINKENLKTIGNAGYRIGKDIVREGSKAVAGKLITGVVAMSLTKGIKGIKEMDLDFVLGDLTRAKKKEEKKWKKKQRKMEKQAREETLKKGKENVEEMKENLEEK